MSRATPGPAQRGPARRHLIIAAGVIAAVVLVVLALRDGSTSRTTTTGAGSTERERDRAVLADQLAGHPPGSAVRSFDRLAETLPNARFSDGSALTDSAVAGRVTEVSHGRGFDETGQAPTQGRPGARIVGFGDPAADWRTLQVTVRVDQVLAGPASREIVLDWPVMGSSDDGEDAAAAARALRGLGRVVVLSQAVPSAAEYLGLRRQIPDRPYGLGLVAHDGALSFPFIDPRDGGSIDGPTFMAGVDTLAELQAAAARPTWTRRA